MNTFLNGLQRETNFDYTENGALAHKSTNSKVLDMFALCGSFRTLTDNDCIYMFKQALQENESLAMKCLFYLRDIRGGQGERRFFRVCFKWLAATYPEIAKRNIANVPEFGRYDDLVYTCLNTKVADSALEFIKHQLAIDVTCKTPSLLAKWLPSENASAEKTRKAGNVIRQYLNMTHKEYRKVLAELRSRINIVEKLMSENRWDEIEFDKIPSKAGMVYKNAFARRDIIAKKYETFAKSDTTKVNAVALYPYEIVAKALKNTDWYGNSRLSDVDRAIIQKYWENQIDVLQGQPCKSFFVIDTSGSMHGSAADAPINIAIGLGMYCAERVGGPFKNHYISFSSRPQLIEIEGVDFVDKVTRIYKTNLCENTNIEATFDLLYKIAKTAKPEDIPDQIIITSDMQIDEGTGEYDWRSHTSKGNWTTNSASTLMEKIRMKWENAGLKCPRLVYWNVDARENTILDAGPDVSFVSGASPLIIKQVMSGKTGYDLMLEILMTERYASVM